MPWHLKSKIFSRFNFWINFFDVQATDSCVADSLTFRLGLTGDLVGSYCGGYPQGPFLSFTGVDYGIMFKTDGLFEGRGFNLTWEVLASDTVAPGGGTPPPPTR